MKDLLPAAVLCIKLAGLSLILAELAARTGAGLLAILPRLPLDAPSRFGIRLLAGWSVLGLALMGCGACGILGIPVAVLLSALGVTYVPIDRRRLLIADAAQAVGRMPRAGLGAILLVGGLSLPPLVVFRPNIDALWYQWGAPVKFLEAHRILLEHVPAAYHLPMPVNLDFIFAFMLGDPRLSSWIVAGSFAAAYLVASGIGDAMGRRDAGWLGLLFAYSTVAIPTALASGTSDLPAAALMVTGAMLWRYRRSAAAALLLGAGVAAKLVVGPVALCWLAVFPPGRNARLRTFVLFGLPVAPWLVKSFLATGNLVYPLCWRVFPSPFWGDANQAANFIYRDPFEIPATRRFLTLPIAQLEFLGREQILLAFGLAAVLLASRARRAGWAALAGIAMTLAAGNESRFALGGLWLLILVASNEFSGRAPVLRLTGGGVLAACVIVRTALNPASPWPALHEMVETLPRQSARRLSTLWTAVTRPEIAEARRVLSVAELRTFPLPGRVVSTGGTGETPLIWTLVKSSRNAADLDRRFRQVGARVMLYNYVSADWIAVRYEGFRWDRRMIGLYVDWCRTRLSPRWRSPEADYANGGFVIYDILRRPAVTPPPGVWFLPGAEPVWGEAFRLEGAGRQREALAAFRKIMLEWPRIGCARSMVGHAFARLDDWRAAAAHLR